MDTATEPVEQYLETFERLRARKRWSTSTATFRFVALTLGAASSTVSFDRLEQTASELRKRARWSSPLKSEVRYVVAAMILRRGLDPAEIHARVFETRAAFKAYKIPSRGTGATLAALLLALQQKGHPVPESQLERLAGIYRRWRKDHKWLTNANDLPAAALHASRDESVALLTRDIEQAYTHLQDAGFRGGNSLQLVSHLLVVDPRGTDTAVQRFCSMAERLREKQERVAPGRYDEVALLALTQETPARIVDRVLDYRDRLRRVKPRPPQDVAFSLAAGIALAADSQRVQDRSTGDLAALQSIQAILEAQQVAMIVAAGGGAAAVSASSGS